MAEAKNWHLFLKRKNKIFEKKKKNNVNDPLKKTLFSCWHKKQNQGNA